VSGLYYNRKMLTAEKTDDDGEMTNESAGLLESGLNTQNEPDIPFCGCLSVRYYQPFFDVDTSDVLSRISNSFFFCRVILKL